VALTTSTYYPFGAEATSSSSEQLKFTGHERDVPSLDYMHARYYNPFMGRFLSVDPVFGTPESPQSWNRYAYVRNSPIGSSDPTGKVTTCDTQNCTTTADTYKPAHSTGQTTVATPEMRAAATAEVEKVAVKNGKQESLGYGVRGADGKLTVEMAKTNFGNTTSNSSGATAKGKVPAGSEFAIHGHIDGGQHHSEGMVDSPTQNGGYGDTESLALKNPMPMATVSKGQVGWHEIRNGQLSFTAPVGAVDKAQQKLIQSNLNSEQKLPKFWRR
jgi:RHS repeat-associated protein